MRTRKIRFGLVATVPALIGLALWGAGVLTSNASNLQTGNGAPSGYHFTLNIHGVAKGQAFTNDTANSGNNIFAPLSGTCKIDLQMGAFDVINSDCINSDALFQLPNPADNTTGDLAYSVYARALTPGSASLTSCFTDTSVIPNQTFCNAGTLVVPLDKVTPPKFTNVSKELLQVCVNGTLEPLFADSNFSYFWNYDNQGLRLAQLRFYQIETTQMGGTGCTSVTPTPTAAATP